MDSMKEKLGLVHVYTGEGKGKTTAAMGLILRASGRGLRVTLLQFMKDVPPGSSRPWSVWKGSRYTVPRK